MIIFKNVQEDRPDSVEKLIKICLSDEITFPSTFFNAIILLADSRVALAINRSCCTIQIAARYSSCMQVPCADRRMNAANVCAKSTNNADFGLAFRARKKKKKKKKKKSLG